MTEATEPVDWCRGEWPHPGEEEPFVTDPECRNCGHKMSCCQSGYGDCVCDSDD